MHSEQLAIARNLSIGDDDSNDGVGAWIWKSRLIANAIDNAKKEATSLTATSSQRECRRSENMKQNFKRTGNCYTSSTTDNIIVSNRADLNENSMHVKRVLSQ